MAPGETEWGCRDVLSKAVKNRGLESEFDGLAKWDQNWSVAQALAMEFLDHK